jgi:hypothetical protein
MRRTSGLAGRSWLTKTPKIGSALCYFAQFDSHRGAGVTVILNSKQLEELENIQDSSGEFEEEAGESEGYVEGVENALAWRRGMIERAVASIRKLVRKPLDSMEGLTPGALVYLKESKRFVRVLQNQDGHNELGFVGPTPVAAKPGKPMKAVKPVKEAKPVKVEKPIKVEKPVKVVAKPVKEVKPVKQAEKKAVPVKAEKPLKETKKPIKAAKPTKAVRPVKAKAKAKAKPEPKVKPKAKAKPVSTPKVAKKSPKKAVKVTKKAVAKPAKKSSKPVLKSKPKSAPKKKVLPKKPASKKGSLAGKKPASRKAATGSDPNSYIRSNFRLMSNKEMSKVTGLSEHTIRRKLGEWGLKRI